MKIVESASRLAIAAIPPGDLGICTLLVIRMETRFRIKTRESTARMMYVVVGDWTSLLGECRNVAGCAGGWDSVRGGVLRRSIVLVGGKREGVRRGWQPFGSGHRN